MTRTRRVTTYLSNVHPVGRTCEVCAGPIHNGQGAYVTSDGRKATHISAGQCTPRV